MSRRMGEFLFWAPRMLCIVFAAFLGMFALDAFGGGQPLWTTVIGFAVHLIPAAVVIVGLVFFWRHELLAAALFGALGIYYAAVNLSYPSRVLVIAGPLFLIGILFLIGWWKRSELRPAT